jgi:hypothetical protein
MALDPLPGEIREGVIGPTRAELAAAVGPPPVLMALVLGQDRPQVPFAEDQHPVGDLRPGGEHEPFRITVGARSPGAGSSRPRYRHRPGPRQMMR